MPKAPYVPPITGDGIPIASWVAGDLVPKCLRFGTNYSYGAGTMGSRLRDRVCCAIRFGREVFGVNTHGREGGKKHWEEGAFKLCFEVNRGLS